MKIKNQWEEWADDNSGVNTRIYNGLVKIPSNLCPICFHPKSMCYRTGEEDLATPGSPRAKSSDFTPRE